MWDDGPLLRSNFSAHVLKVMLKGRQKLPVLLPQTIPTPLKIEAQLRPCEPLQWAGAVQVETENVYFCPSARILTDCIPWLVHAISVHKSHGVEQLLQYGKIRFFNTFLSPVDLLCLRLSGAITIIMNPAAGHSGGRGTVELGTIILYHNCCYHIGQLLDAVVLRQT